MTRTMSLTAALLTATLTVVSNASAEPNERPPDPARAEPSELRPRGQQDGVPPRGFRPPPNPLMIALDADKDGEISAEELENAVTALKSLDGNGDGKLTHDEVRPKRSDLSPREGFGPGRAFDGPRFGGRGPRNSMPWGTRPEAEESERTAPDVSERNAADSKARGREGRGPHGRRPFDAKVMIDHVMSLDNDGDGKLSKDEAPERMSRFFEFVDADQDGFVTRDELDVIVRRHSQAHKHWRPRSGRESQGHWMSHHRSQMRHARPEQSRRGHRNWKNHAHHCAHCDCADHFGRRGPEWDGRSRRKQRAWKHQDRHRATCCCDERSERPGRGEQRRARNGSCGRKHQVRHRGHGDCQDSCESGRRHEWKRHRGNYKHHLRQEYHQSKRHAGWRDDGYNRERADWHRDDLSKDRYGDDFQHRREKRHNRPQKRDELRTDGSAAINLEAPIPDSQPEEPAIAGDPVPNELIANDLAAEQSTTTGVTSSDAPVDLPPGE